ncbi:MAG TPA: PilZ domain-containing protein, partial [Syntrophales bacterium]|nr:PilZ domain-containing protein [Syntrophales bacterium]
MANRQEKERRHHSRKAILAPTLIKKYDLVSETLCTGAITDISLGGARITIPKDVKCEILLDPQ